MRWSDNSSHSDLWCHSVGRPVFESRVPAARRHRRDAHSELERNVGAGRLEELAAASARGRRRAGMGLTILLQETFRTGDAVPESYPAALEVPKAIRPRRPTMDVRDIAEQVRIVGRLRAVDEERPGDESQRT